MTSASPRGGQLMDGGLDRRHWQLCPSGHRIGEAIAGTNMTATGEMERELEQQGSRSRTVKCCIVGFIATLAFFRLVYI
jgi:hypothetical protein